METENLHRAMSPVRRFTAPQKAVKDNSNALVWLSVIKDDGLVKARTKRYKIHLVDAGSPVEGNDLIKRIKMRWLFLHMNTIIAVFYNKKKSLYSLKQKRYDLSCCLPATITQMCSC